MKAPFIHCILAAISLFVVSPAFALTSLRQIKVTNGTAKSVDVSLIFDKKLSPDAAQIELLKDVIQITLKDVAVYPPKIIPVNDKAITKVFAYQFSPKTVRCRLFVKGNAEDYKDRVSISRSSLSSESAGKGLVVHVAARAGTTTQVENPRPFEEVGETVSNQSPIAEVLTTAAGAGAIPRPMPGALPGPSEKKGVFENVTEKTSAEAPSRLTGPNTPLSGEDLKQEQEEKALLDKVLKASNGEKTPDLGKDFDKSEKQPLTGGKALPSFKGVFLKLGGVALFALLLGWAFRKIRGSQKKTGVLGALQRMAKGTLLPKNERLIQVVSTHHIDPKKSIAVVKIAGRLLVLGLSNDSINLITQFGDEGEALGGGDLAEQAFGEESPFTDLLRSEKSKPTMAETNGPSLIPSVRNRIKSRLEGLKPL